MNRRSPRLLARLARAAPLGLVVLAAACGGGGGGSDDWLPDDIDTDATLERAGDSAYRRVCSSFENYVLDIYRTSYLVEAVCTADAIATTEDAASCGDAIDTCKNTPPAEVTAAVDTILAQAGCSAVELTLPGCLAKVSDLAACLTDLEDEVKDLRFDLTCAAAGQPLDESWWRIPLPESCAQLDQEC